MHSRIRVGVDAPSPVDPRSDTEKGFSETSEREDLE
jgi:hypothetical protein